MIEIAGDESGAEGENLAEASHRFFAYGSTDLSVAEAASIVTQIRLDLGTSAADAAVATELKSSPLIAKHANLVTNLISAGGQLSARAHTYIVDKHYFLAAKIVSLVIEEEVHRRGGNLGLAEPKLAHELFDVVAPRLGEVWLQLLSSFNRATRYFGPSRKESPYEFLKTLDRAYRLDRRAGGSVVMELLKESKMRAYELNQDVYGQPIIRQLEPLIPVLVVVSDLWKTRHPDEAVEIVADQQSALTPQARQFIVAAANAAGSELAAIRVADSKSDPRVQIADLLAGVGRYTANAIQVGKSDALVEAGLRITDGRGVWSMQSPIQLAHEMLSV